MRASLLLLAAASITQARDFQKPIKLDEGLKQPSIGFGTWNLKDSAGNTTDAVAIAIESGYRQIDGAAAYRNEVEVGKGIAEGLKRAGLRREEIWVTSKLWNDHHGADRVPSALDQTLKDLNLDYLDLYLMHWPVGKGPNDKTYHYDFIEAWHAMSALLATGKVRYIGISNFSPAQLKELISRSDVKPAVHQMELHPYLNQEKWIRAHQAHGIAVTAYSPLGNMNPTYGDRESGEITTQEDVPLLLENEIIVEIGEKRGCTPAQVVLAWGISRGVSVIPKSKHEKHIKENFGATLCVLEGDDFGRIDWIGKTPKRFNNPSKSWGVDLFKGLDDA